MRRPSPRMYRDVVEAYAMDSPTPDHADDDGNYVRPVTAPPVPYAAIVQPQFATGGDGAGMEMSLTTYDVAIMTDGDPGIWIGNAVTWVGHGFRRQLRALGNATPHTLGAWRFQASEVGPNPHLSGAPAGFTPEY